MSTNDREGYEADVAWVRLIFTDLGGATRAMQIPGSSFERASHDGVRVDGSVLEGRNRLIETDLMLRPDPRTLCINADRIGRVICDVCDDEGNVWPLDPRQTLRQMMMATSLSADGWRGTAELEWYLLRPDLTPIDGEGYFSWARGQGERLLERITTALAGLNVSLIGAHHEAGPGQYEINVAATNPMALADSLVHARTVIADMAHDEGLIATFMARPLNDLPGSGMHIHQVLDSRTVQDQERVERIVAGILEHGAALCAFSASTINSYRRLHRGAEAPSYATWAHASRAALVRLSPAGNETISVEYRGADSSANPYLVLAALLAAGERGVAGGLKLPAPLEENVQGVGIEQAESAPIQLPRSLEQAILALVGDEELVDCFDDRLIGRYCEDLMAEVEASQGFVSEWELRRYLENF